MRATRYEGSRPLTALVAVRVDNNSFAGSNLHPIKCGAGGKQDAVRGHQSKSEPQSATQCTSEHALRAAHEGNIMPGVAFHCPFTECEV